MVLIFSFLWLAKTKSKYIGLQLNKEFLKNETDLSFKKNFQFVKEKTFAKP